MSNSKDAKMAANALKNILKMAVESGNFYEAEHQINRIEQLNIQDEGFKPWKMFIEGVSDLVKRKNSNGCKKLEKAVEIAENHVKKDKNGNS